MKKRTSAGKWYTSLVDRYCISEKVDGSQTCYSCIISQYREIEPSYCVPVSDMERRQKRGEKWRRLESLLESGSRKSPCSH